MNFKKDDLLNYSDRGWKIFKYYHPEIELDVKNGVYVKNKARRSAGATMHIYLWNNKIYFKDHAYKQHKGDMFNYVAIINKLDIKKEFRSVLIEINRILNEVDENNPDVLLDDDLEEQVEKYLSINEHTVEDVINSFNIELAPMSRDNKGCPIFYMGSRRYLQSRIRYEPGDDPDQPENPIPNALFGWEQSLELIYFRYPWSKHTLYITNSPELCIYLSTLNVAAVAMIDDNIGQWAYLKHIIKPQFNKLVYWVDESLMFADSFKENVINDIGAINMPEKVLAAFGKKTSTVKLDIVMDGLGEEIMEFSLEGNDLPTVFDDFIY